MPIRIIKDKNTRSSNSPNRPNNTSGGRGNLIAFLPVLLNLFKKNAKHGIGVAVIGGILYFSGGLDKFLGGDDNQNQVVVAPDMDSDTEYSLGSTYDEEKYVNTEIFASLANNQKSITKQSIVIRIRAKINESRKSRLLCWLGELVCRSNYFGISSYRKPPQSSNFFSFVFIQPNSPTRMPRNLH